MVSDPPPRFSLESFSAKDNLSWLKPQNATGTILLVAVLLHLGYVGLVFHFADIRISDRQFNQIFIYLLLNVVLYMGGWLLHVVSKQVLRLEKLVSIQGSLKLLQTLLYLAFLAMSSEWLLKAQYVNLMFGLPILFLSFRWFHLSSAFLLGFWYVFGLAALRFASEPVFIESNTFEFVLSEWLDLMVFSGLVVLVGVSGWYTQFVSKELRHKNDQLQKALKLVQQLTVKDDQTGLYTSKYMLEILENQKELADRGEYKFVLAKVKIVDYQRFEPKYPEELNIKVIQFVAAELKAQVRALDFCGRVEVDKFLIVLTKTSVEKARLVLERIVQRVKQKSLVELPVFEEINLHVGMTEYSCIETIDETLDRVHVALEDVRQKEGNAVKVMVPKMRRVELVKDSEHQFNPINLLDG